MWRKNKHYKYYVHYCRTNMSEGYMYFYLSWNHPFSTYAKLSEKLTFLTPWRIREKEMLVFGKFCVHTK